MNRNGSRKPQPGSEGSRPRSIPSPSAAPPEAAGGLAIRSADASATVAERRRVSRSLWAACEALLAGAGEPRALRAALEQLRRAFDCESVALHALSPEGRIEPWSTRGDWRGIPGDLRDCLSLPLLRGDERVGSLDLRARAGQRFRAGQVALIRTAAGALGAALGARLELERLRHTPGRDPLTGLPDARSFHARLVEELARARRHGLPLGVATVDLDHFAALNARHGRPAGDAVLREAALLFKLKLRESDVLCRLGGDAFGLILPETDSAAAVRCAERLCRGLEEHRFPRVARVSATGAAAASPRDGVDPAELMERLDRALSVAKKAGRRRVAAPPHAGTH